MPKPASEPHHPIVLRDLFLPRPDLNQKLSDLPWKPFRPGVEIYELYGDIATTPWAALLRYAPGATIPMHSHGSHEHVIVLSESQQDETGQYPTGTLIIHPPGSSHTVTNPTGGIVLVIRHSPVTFSR